MALPASVEDILEGKTPARRVLNLCLDGAIAEQWREAEMNLDIAKGLVRREESEDNKKMLRETESQLEELRPKYEEATRELEMLSLGREEYRALFDKHSPATGQQKARAKKLGLPEPNYNTDTFPPVIISASLVSPELSVEQVKSIFESKKWNESELNLLTYAALEVNQSSAVVSLKKGFGTTFG